MPSTLNEPGLLSRRLRTAEIALPGAVLTLMLAIRVECFMERDDPLRNISILNRLTNLWFQRLNLDVELICLFGLFP